METDNRSEPTRDAPQIKGNSWRFLSRIDVSKVLAGVCALLFLLGIATLLHACFLMPQQAERKVEVGTSGIQVQYPVVLGVRLKTVTGEEPVAVAGPMRIEGMDGSTVSVGKRMPTAKLKVSAGKPFVAGKAMPWKGFRIIPERDGTLQFRGKAYRGSLLVAPSSTGAFRVINEVELESYLRSVVGQEMSPSWPGEALRAQAVASRTYALEHYIRLRNREEQLNIFSMAYQGTASESYGTDRAVSETEGIIMAYNGKPFEAFYSSTCGGQTSSVNFVFDQLEVPPLAGTNCGWCEASPYFRWSFKTSEARLISLLNSEGITAINSIKPAKTDKAGRFREMIVNGSATVPVSSLRKNLGYDKLKSSWFTARKHGDRIVFSGKGWGHGVGMCQYGAKAMAQAGKRWDEILMHYYPESELISVK